MPAEGADEAAVLPFGAAPGRRQMHPHRSAPAAAEVVALLEG
jgi:hypothetical protein